MLAIRVWSCRTNSTAAENSESRCLPIIAGYPFLCTPLVGMPAAGLPQGKIARARQESDDRPEDFAITPSLYLLQEFERDKPSERLYIHAALKQSQP
jgi:hypothetical protein